MDIRVFNNSDRQQVIALWQDLELVVPWNDPNKDIERKLSVDPDTFFVGEVEGKLIATMMVGYDGHRGWVNYLAVASGQQRRGYASKLMTYAEQILIAKGCPKLNLQVRGTNKKVLRFYQSIGYLDDQAVSLGKRLIPDI